MTALSGDDLTISATYDVELIRADFPILQRTLDGGKPLVYLDSANTAQKPQVVIDAISEHYSEHNANVARAVHQLGAEATEAFEHARQVVANFIGARRAEEIVFTKNASEAINLVARSIGDDPTRRIGPGDRVIITEMEHHSNIVPWQQLCERTGATLEWLAVDDDGRLDLDSVTLDERVKIVAVTWVSNVLGTINPVVDITRRAHSVGALVLLDASQAVPQMPVDVAEVGADFIAFTGHKACAPTGIGVLWGKYDLLAAMPPFLGGGEMIEHVTMQGATFAPPPHRFEAGTPPIVQAVGLGVALDYLSGVGMAAIAQHERDMTQYTLAALQQVPGLKIMGPTVIDNRGGAIAFQLDGIHPHDIAQFLDADGIAVRAGNHCAKPIHQRFGVQSSTRVSPYLYTTTAEIDALIAGLDKVRTFFGSFE